METCLIRRSRPVKVYIVIDIFGEIHGVYSSKEDAAEKKKQVFDMFSHAFYESDIDIEEHELEEQINESLGISDR
jgi:hypothetical protein